MISVIVFFQNRVHGSTTSSQIPSPLLQDQSDPWSSVQLLRVESYTSCQ